MESALNGQARKVYDHLPILTSVSVTDLLIKMSGAGMRPERQIVEACLHNLVDRGLAKEQPSGRFRRIEVTKSLAAEPSASAPEPDGPPSDIPAVGQKDEPRPVRNPFDEVADLERQLTAAISSVRAAADALEKVRDGVAAVAVNVEDYLQTVRRDHAKIEALKAMLRDVAQA